MVRFCITEKHVWCKSVEHPREIWNRLREALLMLCTARPTGFSLVWDIFPFIASCLAGELATDRACRSNTALNTVGMVSP